MKQRVSHIPNSLSPPKMMALNSSYNCSKLNPFSNYTVFTELHITLDEEAPLPLLRTGKETRVQKHCPKTPVFKQLVVELWERPKI